MPKTSRHTDPPVNCSRTRLEPLDKILPNPFNYNRHSDEQIALLAKVIKARGWRSPIVVSTLSGFIVKGHARYLAAVLLECKKAPIDLQDYADQREEHADMIADNQLALLAEPDRAILKDLLLEMDDGSFDMELTGYTEDALGLLMTSMFPGEENDEDDTYTNKLVAPIYQPTGDKPKVADLSDDLKVDDLMKRIDAAEVAVEIGLFLRKAAERHRVFDYSRIAEYYAHADKPIQELMEQSALVIIDSDKAIEEGYLRLSKQIAETFRKEAEDDEN